MLTILKTIRSKELHYTNIKTRIVTWKFNSTFFIVQEITTTNYFFNFL
jgi:hypothetical protein